MLFILLSGLRAPISSSINEDERSLKPPSTPSRLILVRPLSFLHHHHSPSPSPFAPNDMQRRRCKALPSIEGSPTNNAQVQNGESKSAPPLSIGMWAAGCCSIEVFGEGETRRGDPGSGRAHVVRPENEPQPSLWFVFVSPSVLPPPH